MGFGTERITPSMILHSLCPVVAGKISENKIGCGEADKRSLQVLVFAK